MFKKRTINNKSITNTQVHDEIKVNNQEKILKGQNKDGKIELQAHQQYHIQQKKMQEKEIQNQDEEFLQRLKRDKKLNDLFADMQAQQKDNNNHKNSHQSPSHEQKHLASRGMNNPLIKIAPYVKKRINFTFTQSNHSTKDNVEQKINLKSSTKQSKQKEQKKQTEIEMEDIFRQIRQHNKKQEQVEIQNLQKQKTYQLPINPIKPIIKANQFIIQDEDGFVQQIPKQQFAFPTVSVQQHGTLKVAVDYQGNLSPQLSQHQDELQDLHHQDDYEDQLIRKTLTRNNYLKLQQKSNLKQTKISHKKEKLFNTILKTSWNDIQIRLSSDINEKVTKKNQLLQQMKYLQERVSQRTSQMDRKKQILKQLQIEQKKLKKVIYFLCYFGDQVCGKNESIETFFSDLTPNIIDKIHKLSDKINIEEFMQKKRSRQQLRQQYHKGRKKIKGNEKGDIEEEIVEQENQDDDQDGEFFMQEDDF